MLENAARSEKRKGAIIGKQRKNTQMWRGRKRQGGLEYERGRSTWEERLSRSRKIVKKSRGGTGAG